MKPVQAFSPLFVLQTTKAGRGGLGTGLGLPRSFCSLVCIDNNTRMWKSGEEWGRPGIAHQVSDVMWTRGGHRGDGARSRFSRSRSSSSSSRLNLNALRLVETLRRSTQLCRPVIKLICGWATHPYVHLTSIM